MNEEGRNIEISSLSNHKKSGFDENLVLME